MQCFMCAGGSASLQSSGEAEENKRPGGRLESLLKCGKRKKHGDSEAPPFGTVINTTLG